MSGLISPVERWPLQPAAPLTGSRARALLPTLANPSPAGVARSLWDPRIRPSPHSGFRDSNRMQAT